MSLILKYVLNSPRLYRVYTLIQPSDNESSVYQPNGIESFGASILKGINIMWNVGLYTSPIVLSYLYQRHFFSFAGCVSLAKFATGLGILLIFGMVIRGLGRVTNPQYRAFFDDLKLAQKAPASLELKKTLRKYDFDFWAWPVDFSVKEIGSEGKMYLAKPDQNAGAAWWLLGLPCHTVAWFCAHLFGRHLVYPGSIHLLQYGIGMVLESGRQKLVTEHNGLRNKLETQDGNTIDTMFIDRRKNLGNRYGSTLVVCCEGNAGFYEIGIVSTPLEAGYSVIGWNHPGFSGSSGAPFPNEEQNAIDAVMQFAIQKLGFNVEDIIVYGWSIGGYSAAYAAMNYPEIRGVVLDATFDDILPLALPRMPGWMGGLVKHTIRKFININIIDFLSQYPGPVSLIRRTKDEIITTIEGQIATNRGNDLLRKLLQSRFPNLVSSSKASETLQKWIVKDPAEQSKIYNNWNIDAELCLTQLISYSSENGEKYPIMIGSDWDDDEKTRMLLYLANKYFLNFDSNHNTMLDSSFFKAPWAPVLDPSYVQLE